MPPWDQNAVANIKCRIDSKPLGFHEAISLIIVFRNGMYQKIPLQAEGYFQITYAAEEPNSP